MWYSAGTVAVTANSATVTGTGTAFSANARVGDAFRGPDGRWYAVTNIASASVISISPAYQGDTATDQEYAIAPIQGYVKDSADRLRQITDQFGTILADLGENGPSIKVDAAGLLADRAAYDGRSAGFAYYATDTELLYIKLGGAADAWSLGAPVAVGPAGPMGDVTPEALQARDDAQAAAVAASDSAATAAQAVSSVQASAQTAADSAVAADSSANGALASEQKAEQWAENSEDSPVEPGQFSAKHHATKAAASAESASGSASSASTSAASASDSATAASDSASAAGQSASAAAASASTASTKAGESSSSASAAAQSSQEAQQAAAAVAAIGAGWTPVLSVVSDGERRVLQVTDWTGGQSNKPATGQYVGASGLVSSIASAVNIRGAAGSGSVQTVAGVAPDANGNVALGPSNVGALPSNGTASDSSKLGGQLPSHYAAASDIVGVYKRSNILGAVSQSAGVPTGAIIERGSNSNGEYVRFADGSQKCLKAVSIAFLQANTYYNSVSDWPAAFSVAPRVIACIASSNASPTSSILFTGSSTATSATVSGACNVVNTSSIILLAEGRWF
jgi:hypothetical protein